MILNVRINKKEPKVLNRKRLVHFEVIQLFLDKPKM